MKVPDFDPAEYSLGNWSCSGRDHGHSASTLETADAVRFGP